MPWVDPKFGKVEANGGAGGGFVKGVVTYTVKDDLMVTPMSTILSSEISLSISEIQNIT